MKNKLELWTSNSGQNQYLKSDLIKIVSNEFVKNENVFTITKHGFKFDNDGNLKVSVIVDCGDDLKVVIEGDYSWELVRLYYAIHKRVIGSIEKDNQ